MPRQKPELESKIETYFKKRIAAVGGLTYKFKSTVNGVPDQLVIHDGMMHLVEVKRPGEVPRANQVQVHKNINKRGVPVHTVATTDDVDRFMVDVLGETGGWLEPANRRPNVPTIQGASLFGIDPKED